MRLTDEQLAHYHEEGYVLVKGIFDPEKDIDPVIEEYKGVLDNLAQDLCDSGEITSRHEELPFAERLIAIYQGKRQSPRAVLRLFTAAGQRKTGYAPSGPGPPYSAC